MNRGLFGFAGQGNGFGGTKGQPRMTRSPMSSGPPVAPRHGDVWIASDVDTLGACWMFQYNLKATSIYKWEFIGGAPMIASSTGPDALANSSAWQNPVTDVKVTLSAHTDGKIYLENRSGASRDFTVLLRPVTFGV